MTRRKMMGIFIFCSCIELEPLLRTLAEEGFPPEAVRRVVVPVGLPIGAETPAEIAVSIVAQLVRKEGI